MVSEKHGRNVGLKNRRDFRELYFKKTMRNVIFCLQIRLLTDFYMAKMCFHNNSTVKSKSWKPQELYVP